MKKNLQVALFSILTFECSAQIKFEKGYLITNDGKRNDCLIKNSDWLHNPTIFFYKDSEDSKIQKADIENVSEFGILNFSKYKRYNVDVDTSRSSIDEINDNKFPEFKREKLFLKVLTEGKASLYLFKDKTLTRFFFSTDSLNTEQLIFKTYYQSQNLIAENNTFRDQILDNLQCSSINLRVVEKAKYEKNDLVNLFDSYNACQKSNSVSFETKHQGGSFNLNFKPGVNISNLTIFDNSNGHTTTALGSNFSLTAGVEAEFILPFNKNSWSAIFEPAFQYYKSASNSNVVKVNYKSIELSAGFRHYFFLNAKSKIFITGLLFYDFPISSTLNYGSVTLNFASRIDGGLSVGYKYQNRYGVELKYELIRNILDDYDYLKSHFNTTSIIFSFKLF